MQAYYPKKMGQLVNAGDTVIDFRGQEWEFVKATRITEIGKSGKVIVKDKFNRQREFYAHVFELSVK